MMTNTQLYQYICKRVDNLKAAAAQLFVQTHGAQNSLQGFSRWIVTEPDSDLGFVFTGWHSQGTTCEQTDVVTKVPSWECSGFFEMTNEEWEKLTPDNQQELVIEAATSLADFQVNQLLANVEEAAHAEENYY